MRKQRLNDVQSSVGATATRAHVESALRTELLVILVDSCSARHQGNCCASTREIPATWISIRARGTEGCSRDKTAALARHKHTWISLRAQRDMFWRSCCVLTPGAQLDLSPCARRLCHCDNTAAFARCEHTLVSLSAPRGTFRRKDCCVLTLRANLDLSPCASKNTCSIEKTAAFARHKHTWISLPAQRDTFHRKDCCDLALPPKIADFYLRTPDPISTVKRAHVPYAFGNA